MEQEKKIRVTCDTKHYLPLDELKPIQGGLKSLSDERKAELQFSIEKNGFCAPIFVWWNGSNRFILDGHQRRLVLLAMREAGWEVPNIPVVPIQAEDLKSAKEKVLAFVAQYGEVTGQGLYDFLNDAGIDAAQLHHYPMQGVDLQAFMPEFFPDDPATKRVAFDASEGGGDSKSNYTEQYGVIAICRDSVHQEEVFNKISGMGIPCKVVVT